jgi:hypothetical protein
MPFLCVNFSRAVRLPVQTVDSQCEQARMSVGIMDVSCVQV